MKKLFIAADHAGFELKTKIMSAHPELPWEDLGTFNLDSVDYPDFSDKLCGKMIEANRGFPATDDALSAPAVGVLVCGSGQGVAIRANRYPEIRAALCWNAEVAAVSRQHNNANVLTVGSRFVTADQANEILKTFLGSPFEGGRHATRVQKLS